MSDGIWVRYYHNTGLHWMVFTDDTSIPIVSTQLLEIITCIDFEIWIREGCYLLTAFKLKLRPFPQSFAVVRFQLDKISLSPYKTSTHRISTSKWESPNLVHGARLQQRWVWPYSLCWNWLAIIKCEIWKHPCIWNDSVWWTTIHTAMLPLVMCHNNITTTMDMVHMIHITHMNHMRHMLHMTHKIHRSSFSMDPWKLPNHLSISGNWK